MSESNRSAIRILADRWIGVFNEEERYLSPSDSILELLLDRLDACVHTILILENENGSQLTIGGGSGQYIVYASHDGNTFWNLCGTDKSSGVLRLNIGGQEGEYSVKQVVSRHSALQVARTFMSNGSLDTKFNWCRG